MTVLGHSRKFSTRQRHVWNAVVNRHSAPNVGYRVTGRVKLMTGLGTELPHKYVCSFRWGSAEVTALIPG